MVNVEQLKKIIDKNGFSVESICKKIDMDSVTFYRRLNRNGLTFTIREISALANVLNLSGNDVLSIFFAQIVA